MKFAREWKATNLQRSRLEFTTVQFNVEVCTFSTFYLYWKVKTKKKRILISTKLDFPKLARFIYNICVPSIDIQFKRLAIKKKMNW